MRHEPRQPRADVNVSHSSAGSELVTLLLGTIAVVAALMLAIFLVVEAVAWLLPPAWESRLLRPLVAELYDDAGAQDARVQALLDRLASHWPDRPYGFELHVADRDEPNAFALPGGAVVVNRGLLEEIETENELAFVLAHEVGHFHNRDHIRRLGREGLAQLVVIAFGMAGAEALPALVTDLTQRSFDREQESEADAFGLTLLFAEYGHLGGADAFFAMLPDAEASLGEKLGSYLETHPVTEERIDALGALAEQQGWPRQGEERSW